MKRHSDAIELDKAGRVALLSNFTVYNVDTTRRELLT